MTVKQAMVDSEWKAPDGTGYNDPPKDMREITEEEFARSWFFTYDWERYEFRQVFVASYDDLKPGRGRCLTLRLYWMHDGTGFAMESRDGRLHYYAFGCRHTFRGLGLEECRERGIYHGGRCYHVSECTACGFVHAVDSSD